MEIFIFIFPLFSFLISLLPFSSNYLNIPFITIPFPYAKDNHQFYNGNFYKNKNCCWLLEQKSIKNNEIFDLIAHITSDHQDVESKINQMQKISYQNTWNNINQKLLGVINEN